MGRGVRVMKEEENQNLAIVLWAVATRRDSLPLKKGTHSPVQHCINHAHCPWMVIPLLVLPNGV